MEQNILLLYLITLVCYFVVGNPYTYAIMSKITTLKVKDKKQHMILVGIHAVVKTLLMYGAYLCKSRRIKNVHHLRNVIN